MEPKPVVTAQVCSVCGLPWEDHAKRPTIEGCVKLLKVALEKARGQAAWPITTSTLTNTQAATPWRLE